VSARSGLLLLVLLVAALHVLVTASTRPMLQVSDEVSYLYSAQYTAAGQHRVSPTLYPCLSPPDGNMLPLAPSGKVGYRETSARLLVASCRAVGPYSAFVLTRVALGVSLLVIVASGWAFAAVIAPRTPLMAPTVAAVLALHPVLVIYSAGITPDSWANAWAALAWLLSAVMLAKPPALRWLPVLTSCVLLAILWKDTTHFMAVLPVALVPLAILMAERRRPHHVLFGVLWIGLCAAIVVVGREWIRSPYGIAETFIGRVREAPLSVAGLLLADVLPRLLDLFASSWRELGSFGASPRSLAAGVFVPIAVASLVALGGLVKSVVGRPARMDDATAHRWRVHLAIWATAVLLCAMQAAARRVAQPNADVDQGRWLFPLAVPLATALVGGLMAWVRRPALLAPLIVGGAAITAMVAYVQVVGHYFVRFPVTYARERLFLSGTGGLDVGRVRVEGLMTRPDALGDGSTMGLLIGATVLAVIVLLVAISRASSADRARG
jgi:hypothetical protein